MCSLMELSLIHYEFADQHVIVGQLLQAQLTTAENMLIIQGFIQNSIMKVFINILKYALV